MDGDSLTRRTKNPDSRESIPGSLTPLMRQYQRIKLEHQDEILLFRLGDFYETFGEDAKLAADILNITLTKKHVAKGQTLPLAGIPYHALDNYLRKLIHAGLKVAICEQTEDPKTAKGLVRREVTRVVTPGTVIEEGILDDQSNNYLACVARHQGNWGLALVEMSTGALGATEFFGNDARCMLLNELTRIQPAELLATDEDWKLVDKPLKEIFGTGHGMMITHVDSGMVLHDRASMELLDHLSVSSLQTYGADDSPSAVCAAGAIIRYLRETQKRSLGHIRDLQIYSIRDTMILDATTQRSLELVKNSIDNTKTATILHVLDHTHTPMGARLIHKWVLNPLQDLEMIRGRQDSIESLIDNTPVRQLLRDGLKNVRDLERILGRVHCYAANARDMVMLLSSLKEIPAIKSQLLRLNSGRFEELGSTIQTMSSLADRLENAFSPGPPVSIREGGMIREGYRPELDELIGISRGGKDWITRMRETEIERTGIQNLKIGYNRVFGYFIEVSKSNLEKIPPDYIRRQTLTNAERFITPELKEQEELILGAEEKIHQLEYDIFQEEARFVMDLTMQLQQLAGQLAEVDVLLSLAEAARVGGYVRPEMDGSDQIEILDGRHPVIESIMTDQPFVPNDVRLDSHQQQIWLITGPNMAGKSTFIRQVALLTLMAHVGSFIPARQARIGLVDRIFTRVGATDFLVRGQSTFLVEMIETANILHNASERSLVILDEIGRGTSTYDGLAIAWSVIEYLHEKPRRRAKTLFATHYHELTELEHRHDRIFNYNVAVREADEKITFLYQIIRGGADRSYGIYAAQLAGMPDQTVDRAKEILFNLECNRSSGGDLDPNGGYQCEKSGGAVPGMPIELPAEPTEIIQPDLFGSGLPPIFDKILDVDVNTLTPVQAIKVLDDLIQVLRKMRS
jgi:DNA mismatch repair protein MutS